MGLRQILPWQTKQIFSIVFFLLKCRGFYFNSHLLSRFFRITYQYFQYSFFCFIYTDICTDIYTDIYTDTFVLSSLLLLLLSNRTFLHFYVSCQANKNFIQTKMSSIISSYLQNAKHSVVIITLLTLSHNLIAAVHNFATII